MIGYADGGGLARGAEAYGSAWEAFDGDAWVALFSDDAEYHEDPYGSPLVGHNALRAFLLDAATSQRDVEFDDRTALGLGHDGARGLACIVHQAVHRSDRPPRRVPDRGGPPDGRVSRFREWTRYAPKTGG